MKKEIALLGVVLLAGVVAGQASPILSRFATQQPIKSSAIPATRLAELRAIHDARVGRAIGGLITESRRAKGLALGDNDYWFKVLRTIRGGADTFSVSTHRQPGAAPRRIYLATYDAVSKRLIGWSSVEVEASGITRTDTHMVDYSGPRGETPLATTVVINRDAQFRETSRTKAVPAVAGEAPPLFNPEPQPAALPQGTSTAAQRKVTAPVITADRLAKMRGIQESRLAQIFRDLDTEFRTGAGLDSKAPGLTDIEGLNRTDPKLPAGDWREPSDPLGGLERFDSLDQGLRQRLRQPTPRSSVVPGAGVPRDNSGLVSLFPSVETRQFSGSWGSETRVTTRDPATGATISILTVTYERVGRGERLSGWSTTAVDRLGNSKTEVNHVVHTGPDGRTPVVVTHTETKSPGGPVTSTEPSEPRPLTTQDPPVTSPVPRGGTTPDPAETVTGDETAGGRGPLGLECNPITGQCSYGMSLSGGNQVNPGPEGQPSLI